MALSLSEALATEAEAETKAFSVETEVFEILTEARPSQGTSRQPWDRGVKTEATSLTITTFKLCVTSQFI